MKWLLLAHAVALGLYWYAPYFWLKKDAADFGKDVTKDTFGRTFHRQRLLWRVGFAVLVALLASLPSFASSSAVLIGYLLSSIGLLAIGTGWYGYVFNPGLNLARKLPYIGKYHVSWAANASFLDQFIWQQAWERVYLETKSHQFDFVPGQRDEAVIPVAAKMLREWLLKGLLGGLFIYACALAFLFTRQW